MKYLNSNQSIDDYISSIESNIGYVIVGNNEKVFSIDTRTHQIKELETGLYIYSDDDDHVLYRCFINMHRLILSKSIILMDGY